jgi:hypothetical protein
MVISHDVNKYSKQQNALQKLYIKGQFWLVLLLGHPCYQQPAGRLETCYKHVVHENLIGGSSIIWVFPLVIANSEREMPGIEPWAKGKIVFTKTSTKFVHSCAFQVDACCFHTKEKRGKKYVKV